MGLFDAFKGSKFAPRTDLTWQNQEAKLRGSIMFLRDNKVNLCVAWFEETQRVFQEAFNRGVPKGPDIVLAKTLFPYSLDNKNVLFLEHYPLFSKEENLLGKAKPAKTWFVNSLNDPAMVLFKGNIDQLLERLGMKPDECLEHSMISASIVRAQKKLEKEVFTDYSAKSGDDWVRQFLANRKK